MNIFLSAIDIYAVLLYYTGKPYKKYIRYSSILQGGIYDSFGIAEGCGKEVGSGEHDAAILQGYKGHGGKI